MSLARMAAPVPALPYERHQPEQTLLYQLIETHYPRFRAQLEAEGKTLPPFVQQEFDDFLKCGRLDYGFLRVYSEDCKHERLVAFSCKRRGFCPSKILSHPPVEQPAKWLSKSQSLYPSKFVGVLLLVLGSLGFTGFKGWEA